ncbi:hypothetical protein B1B04_08565 [Lysinibacillus sp. KCTC 33748]|nr:hypothetical protein B1B04_08565 [Lysinibacillus sp. KCTC 33748]SKB60152.1 hypothetical protein SAMN06295926_104196 [Lysinibacillus sp. AC-3]
MYFAVFRSIRNLSTYESLTVFMGNKGWFIGVMYSGVLSAVISDILDSIPSLEMINLFNTFIIVAALALCGEPGGQNM